MSETTIEDLMALDLEYRLTIGFRAADGGCDCVRYFIERREVLIPAVLEQAEKTEADACELFAAFARKVHARHEDAPPSPDPWRVKATGQHDTRRTDG